MINISKKSIGIVFLLCWLCYAYKPWFKPTDFLSSQKQKRKNQNVTNFRLFKVTSSIYQANPMFELWFTRFIIVIGIIICLLFIFSSE